MPEEFQIVFVKLAEATAEEGKEAIYGGLDRAELDSIDELRRLAIETLRPQGVVLTTT